MKPIPVSPYGNNSWFTRKRKEIKLKNLSDGHLKNIIECIKSGRIFYPLPLQTSSVWKEWCWRLMHHLEPNDVLKKMLDEPDSES